MIHPTRLLLALLFFFTSLSVFSHPPDSAFWYYQQGRHLAHLEQMSASKQALLTSSELYRNRQVWDSCILSLLRTKMVQDPGLDDQLLEQVKELAQTHLAPSHRIWADISCFEGEIRNKEGALSEAQAFFEKTLKICEKEGDAYLRTAHRAHIGLGINAMFGGKISASLHAFETAMAIGYKAGMAPIDMDILMQNLAIAYVHAGQMDKGLNMLLEVKELLENYLPPDRPYLSLGRIYGSIGNLYDQKRAFHLSAQYYQKEIQIKEAILPANHPDLARSYRHMATVYKEADENAQALIYQTRAYEIDLIAYGEQSTFMAVNHYGLANYYFLLRNNEQALIHSKASIELELQKPKHPGSNLPFAYNQLGQIYAEMGQYQQAIDEYQKGIEVVAEYGSFDHPTLPVMYQSIGKAHIALHQYEQARQWLDKYLQDSREVHGPQHPDVSCAMAVLGELEDIQGNTLKYREYIDQALGILLPDFNAYQSFIPTSDLPFGYLGDVINALNQKSNGYLKAYESSSEEALLLQAWDNQQLVLGLLDSLYLQEIEQNSQQSFQSYYQYVYHTSQNILYALYQERQDKQYIQLALDVAERNKSNVLRKAFLKARLNSEEFIPASVLATDQQFKDSLLFLQQTIDQLTGTKDSLDRLELGKKKFDLLRKYQVFQEEMELEYPVFFQQISSLESLSITEIQEEVLDPAQILVEYSWGEKNLHIIAISTSDVTYKQIPHSPRLSQHLSSLRTLISAEDGIDLYDQESLDSAFQHINQVSQQVYSALIGPILSFIENAEHLLIIPDNELGFIPFEMLMPPESGLMDQPAFLINDFHISYAFSVNLLEAMKSAHPPSRRDINLLVMSPVFEQTSMNKNKAPSSMDRRDTYFPLPFSKEESSTLALAYKGSLFSDSLASKSQFLSLAPKSRIIHLATHAKAYSKDSRFSHIAFSPTNNRSEQDNQLQVSEIYVMRLPADMVVLSACETGLGELKKGEGIISLGRAFTYAGAKSIVSTLWSVNDQSTSELMISFYRYLDQGMRKDAALRQAKLDYLQSHDEQFSHPYFWAAPIAIGDMAPIQLRSNTNWVWILSIIAIALSLVGMMIWRKRQKIA